MSDMSYPTKEKSQFMNVQGGEKKVMKKILSVALSTAMAFSMFASVAFGATATEQQAYDALKAKGVVEGYPGGAANLEKDLTRAEFAKIITKTFALTEITNKLSYNDKNYNAKMWARPYIEAVTAANLMQGKNTAKGLFDFNGKVTIEEVAKVLVIAQKLDVPTTTDNNASTWAKGYAQAIIDAGLATKDTNFKANASRGLVFSTIYGLDQKTQAPAITSAEAVSPTSVVVKFADKGELTVTLTTALVQGVETPVTFKYKDHDYTTKVTLQAPKVVSVTAPNSKQVVIKFNRPVDAESFTQTSDKGVTTLVYGAASIGNLSGAPVVNVDTASVVLTSEGTEAWLTFADNQYLKGQYTFILNDKVKTTSGETISAYTQLLPVNDVTAPTIASVTSTAKATTNKVHVKLSEPVKGTGTVIAYVNGQPATVALRDNGAALDELTLTTANNLESGKTYDVSLTNIVDFAGNYIAPNPTKTTVTVVSDVAAPTVSKVTVTGENSVEVVFNKKMDIATLHGNITLLNANGETRGAFQVKQGKDATTFNLTNFAINFPSSSTFAGTIVFGATIKDYLGNTVAASTTQPVTFTKDVTAPTVVSAVYAKEGLLVKFSEKVSLVNSAGVIKIINDSTGYPTTLTANVVGTDGKQWRLTGATLGTGNYTLRLPAGIAVDQSQAKNGLVAVAYPVSITADTVVDSNKPVITAAPVVVTSEVYKTDQVVQFTVQDSSGLNIASVREYANYTWDGKALPVGSYVSTDYNGSGSPTTPVVVSVNIPSSGINTNDSKEFVINGITDTSGNVIVPTPYQVALRDGVRPTLNTAAVASGDGTKLVIGFSEDVINIRPDGSDFLFTINGNIEVASPNVVINTTPGVGSDKGKFYVTFKTQKGVFNGADVLYMDNNKDGAIQHNEVVYTTDAAGDLKLSANYIGSITVKVRDTAQITDKSGNKVVVDTIVSATK
ncbi:Ig-like domain-containing protein [Paenibacillus donghaensis]|uniref:SLH domain-containing protein n=1 Tax=Paenibacillus donghaensis TaxID=414771 RepID=A0A2Z2KU52_9BACL|nr:Ig-like domain-containing protein [Paenibacillus donghaensis]ASA24511.1 hypothetical protein B9T62_29420 [Paenibacillus donghaensis]